jgi:hypothetical protein
MTRFDRSGFAPAITPLLDGESVPDLGPGTPDRAALDRLRALTPESVAAPAPVSDGDAARACLAGLWLLYDFLDESHVISQGLHTPEGSYYAGVMHRPKSRWTSSTSWWSALHPFLFLGPILSRA